MSSKIEKFRPDVHYKIGETAVFRAEDDYRYFEITVLRVERWEKMTAIEIRFTNLSKHYALSVDEYNFKLFNVKGKEFDYSDLENKIPTAEHLGDIKSKKSKTGWLEYVVDQAVKTEDLVLIYEYEDVELPIYLKTGEPTKKQADILHEESLRKADAAASHLVKALYQNKNLLRVADTIVGAARSGIRVFPARADDAQIPPGVSKFGGEPDLPPDWKWQFKKYDRTVKKDDLVNETRFIPTVDGVVPMSFLAQINLAETAPFDADKLLPETGILYFFYLPSMHLYYTGLSQPDDFSGFNYDLIKVLHYTGDLSALRRTAFPAELSADYRFPAQTLSFQIELTLPHFESPFLQDNGETLNFTERERYAYSEEIDWNALQGRSRCLLLGHEDPVNPYPIGTNTKSQLLLQINGGYFEAYTMGGRQGCLYTSLDSDDLRKQDWDAVRCTEY